LKPRLHKISDTPAKEAAEFKRKHSSLSVKFDKEPEEQGQNRTPLPTPMSDDAYTTSVLEVHPEYEYQLIKKLTATEAEIECNNPKKWLLLFSQISGDDELWTYSAKWLNYGEHGIAIVRNGKAQYVVMTSSYKDFGF
jgi:hypothetical protein